MAINSNPIFTKEDALVPSAGYPINTPSTPYPSVRTHAIGDGVFIDTYSPQRASGSTGGVVEGELYTLIERPANPIKVVSVYKTNTADNIVVKLDDTVTS